MHPYSLFKFVAVSLTAGCILQACSAGGQASKSGAAAVTEGPSSSNAQAAPTPVAPPTTNLSQLTAPAPTATPTSTPIPPPTASAPGAAPAVLTKLALANQALAAAACTRVSSFQPATVSLELVAAPTPPAAADWSKNIYTADGAGNYVTVTESFSDAGCTAARRLTTTTGTIAAAPNPDYALSREECKTTALAGMSVVMTVSSLTVVFYDQADLTYEQAMYAYNQVPTWCSYATAKLGQPYDATTCNQYESAQVPWTSASSADTSTTTDLETWGSFTTFGQVCSDPTFTLPANRTVGPGSTLYTTLK